MRCSRTCFAVVLALFSIAALVSPVAADPLPGQILKFVQEPMIATPIGGITYSGHDELSTLYASSLVPGVFEGTAMADDFADRFNTEVVHVRWWGSYLNDFQNPDQPINKFLIAFESDAEVNATNPFSHPNEVLSFQTVDRVPAGPLVADSGTYTEELILASPVESIYEYNAELKIDFNQDPDTVYWIKIAALVEGPNQGGTTGDTRWGWHNRDYTVTNPLASVAPFVIPGEVDEQPTVDPMYPTEVWHFQDDAVSADTFFGVDINGVLTLTQDNYVRQDYVDDLDGPGPIAGVHGGIGQFSKDLAFELYTIPEPSSVILMMFGLAALTGTRRRHPPSS